MSHRLAILILNNRGRVGKVSRDTMMKKGTIQYEVGFELGDKTYINR